MADNKLRLNAGWDDALLSLELEELEVLGFDLDLIGFSETERIALLAQGTPGLTDPDDVPAIPETPITQTGDVWVMGRHRLICGDSTSTEDVRAIAGRRVAAPDGDRSALRRELRSRLAEAGRCEPERRQAWQGRQR